MVKNRNTKSIMVTSTKGGVGKTIMALNLAGVFSTIEKKVLIIDLDLTGGNIAVALNKPYDKSIYEMTEDIKNNIFESFDDYVLEYNKSIHFIACPKDPRDAAKIDMRYLDMVIERAKYIYDIILFDTSHVLNATNLYLMEKSDDILFIINNDMLNLKNTRSILAILNNNGYKNYRVILNNSNNPLKDYYSIFDIKKIIQANIDYTISNDFFIENIDKELMASNIPTLSKKFAKSYSNDFATFMSLVADIASEGSDEDGN